MHLYHWRWHCISVPLCSMKPQSSLKPHQLHPIDQTDMTHVRILIMNIYSLYFYDSKSTVNTHWLHLTIFCEFPLELQSVTKASLFPQKPTKPHHKMSSFLNGVSAGEAKSLKPIRCVIDSFLKAGLPDGLIVECELPSLLHIRGPVCAWSRRWPQGIQNTEATLKTGEHKD